MKSLRTSLYVLAIFTLAAMACSAPPRCPNGWEELGGSTQCTATTSRMVELVEGLGTTGVYGYSGYVETGLPPCGADIYEPLTAPLRITQATGSECSDDEVAILTPNAEGEWAMTLPAGDYCAGRVAFVVDEGLFTEVAVGL